MSDISLFSSVAFCKDFASSVCTAILISTISGGSSVFALVETDTNPLSTASAVALSVPDDINPTVIAAINAAVKYFFINSPSQKCPTIL